MNRVSVYCGLIIAVLFLIMHFIVGFIPVNGGTGWDGRVYVLYIELLGQGNPFAGDPYRSIRLSGFLPLVLASYLGASKDFLIYLQAFINAMLLSIGAALLHDVMLKLNAKKMVATLSIAILCCSWVFLCMPMFYPVLSDNVALALVCICLWCWVRSYTWAVYVCCAFFTWLIPGLFLIPLVLATFPYAREHKTVTEHVHYKYALWLLTLIAVPLSALLLVMIYHVPLADVAAHSVSNGGKTASVDMIFLSASAMLVCLFLIIWIAVKLVLDPMTWKSVSPSGFVAGSLFFIASALVMKISFDWKTGFSGPPLLDYMFYQSLAVPFKPLVAHFISFGPVILLSIYACLSWASGEKHAIPKAMIVVFLAFLPLLAFGSESRQWIGILPVIIVIFATADFSNLTRVWCLIVSALVFAPSLWIKPYVAMAASTGLGFQSYQWQFYFGRQGPWMSLTVYQAGLVAALCFIAVAILINKKITRPLRSAAP